LKSEEAREQMVLVGDSQDQQTACTISNATLVVDEVTSSVKLMRHSAISIAGQLILDVFHECNKFGIAEIQSPCGGSVVERASR